MLAKAWGAIGGSEQLAGGVRWQGRAGPLLMFALVALPLLSASSVLAVAGVCNTVSDGLLGLLGWGALVTQRRLSRFVVSPRHDWGQVLEGMVRAITSHEAMARGDRGMIAVDSTTVEKRYGPRLPEIRPVYDATRKRLVDGYEVVSACVVGLRGTLPVGLVPHRKAPTASEREALKRRRRKAREGEWPSKLDLALGLVEAAIGGGVRAGTVVGDSAFAVMWWLRELGALGRHWLVATRQDRRLRIGAEIRAFRDWAKAAPVELVEAEANGRMLYGALWPQVTLLDRHRQRKGLECQAAYLERRNRKGKVIHRWYLLTDQMEWDLATIWERWGWRWGIEVLHRDCKQHLHLADFHVRSWEGIVALLALTSLRSSLLWLMQSIDPACRALSSGALVAALGKAACTVEMESGQVSLPPSLKASVLWQVPVDSVLAQWCPIVTRNARHEVST